MPVAAQRPRGEREAARAAGGQQHVRALRGHRDLVAQPPRQAAAEHAAEGGDEGQAGGDLQRQRRRRSQPGEASASRSRTSPRPGSEVTAKASAASTPATSARRSASRRRSGRRATAAGSSDANADTGRGPGVSVGCRDRQPGSPEELAGTDLMEWPSAPRRSWDARSVAWVQPPVSAGATMGPARLDGAASRTIGYARRFSAVEVRQHGQHAPVPVRRPPTARACEKIDVTCFSIARSVTTRSRAIAPLERPCAIWPEHLALARRQPVQRIVGAAAAEQLRDDLGIEHRAAARRRGAARR